MWRGLGPFGGELTEEMCQMRGESQSELSEPGVADMYTYMHRIHIHNHWPYFKAPGRVGPHYREILSKFLLRSLDMHLHVIKNNHVKTMVDIHVYTCMYMWWSPASKYTCMHVITCTASLDENRPKQLSLAYIM